MNKRNTYVQFKIYQSSDSSVSYNQSNEIYTKYYRLIENKDDALELFRALPLGRVSKYWISRPYKEYGNYSYFGKLPVDIQNMYIKETVDNLIKAVNDEINNIDGIVGVDLNGIIPA